MSENNVFHGDFSAQEKGQLNLLQGTWVFWKIPMEKKGVEFYAFYAWKSEWDKGQRIINRGFEDFFLSVVTHEEQHGYSIPIVDPYPDEMIPANVQSAYEEDSGSIPESQLLKDPAFEVEGGPDEEEIDPAWKQDDIHPVWKQAEENPKEAGFHQAGVREKVDGIVEALKNLAPDRKMFYRRQ